MAITKKIVILKNYIVDEYGYINNNVKGDLFGTNDNDRNVIDKYVTEIDQKFILLLSQQKDKNKYDEMQYIDMDRDLKNGNNRYHGLDINNTKS